MKALLVEDWNFDAVPDAELVACCYWVGDDASLSHDEKIEKVRAILFGGNRSNNGHERDKPRNEI